MEISYRKTFLHFGPPKEELQRSNSLPDLIVKSEELKTEPPTTCFGSKEICSCPPCQALGGYLVKFDKMQRASFRAMATHEILELLKETLSASWRKTLKKNMTPEAWARTASMARVEKSGDPELGCLVQLVSRVLDQLEPELLTLQTRREQNNQTDQDFEPMPESLKQARIRAKKLQQQAVTKATPKAKAGVRAMKSVRKVVAKAKPKAKAGLRAMKCGRKERKGRKK
eukprot:s5_g38.t1